MDEITARRGYAVGLGIPAFSRVTGRAVTTMATPPAGEEPRATAHTTNSLIIS
jgi:hypothetical protein